MEPEKEINLVATQQWSIYNCRWSLVEISIYRPHDWKLSSAVITPNRIWWDTLTLYYMHCVNLDLSRFVTFVREKEMCWRSIFVKRERERREHTYIIIQNTSKMNRKEWIYLLYTLVVFILNSDNKNQRNIKDYSKESWKVEKRERYKNLRNVIHRVREKTRWYKVLCVRCTIT